MGSNTNTHHTSTTHTGTGVTPGSGAPVYDKHGEAHSSKLGATAANLLPGDNTHNTHSTTGTHGTASAHGTHGVHSTHTNSSGAVLDSVTGQPHHLHETHGAGLTGSHGTHTGTGLTGSHGTHTGTGLTGNHGTHGTTGLHSTDITGSGLTGSHGATTHTGSGLTGTHGTHTGTGFNDAHGTNTHSGTGLTGNHGTTGLTGADGTGLVGSHGGARGTGLTGTHGGIGGTTGTNHGTHDHNTNTNTNTSAIGAGHSHSHGVGHADAATLKEAEKLEKSGHTQEKIGSMLGMKSMVSLFFFAFCRAWARLVRSRVESNCLLTGSFPFRARFRLGQAAKGEAKVIEAQQLKHQTGAEPGVAGRHI
jgi:hypothetical protein